MTYIKEACVETLEQAVIAERKGADRVELCADLALDGLTPSEELMREAKTALTVPIRAMIRPRGGDFFYSGKEIAEMKASIDLCREIGIEGVVFGMTDNTHIQLDTKLISELADHAGPLKVTIHKAIDVCRDPLAELGKLLDLGTIDAVLTSGKAATAQEGTALLKMMVQLATDQLEVIACGKVTLQNLPRLHLEVGSGAYHGKKIVGSLS